jgi:putative cardiolipin synthase
MTDFRFYKILVLLVFVGLFAGCATVSFDQPKSYSVAITDTGDTLLGKSVADWVALNEGLSGFYPLRQGMDRNRTARHAVRSRVQRICSTPYFLC